jgi:hypothetical protein
MRRIKKRDEDFRARSFAVLLNYDDRFEVLILLLQRLQEMMKTMPPDAHPVRRVVKKINGLLRRYVMSPQIFVDESGIANKFVRAGGIRCDQSELAVLERLRRLTADGQLDRIQQCTFCKKKWFFRKRKTQHFCSAKCRKADYEATPGRKKLRNRKQLYLYYMKKPKTKWISFKQWERQQERKKAHGKERRVA